MIRGDHVPNIHLHRGFNMSASAAGPVRRRSSVQRSAVPRAAVSPRAGDRRQAVKPHAAQAQTLSRAVGLSSRIIGFMRVELLLVPSCPNELAAAIVLRDALALAGRNDADFETVVIDSPEAAERRGFVGSPSFFLNGRDLLPTPDALPAVACRGYWGESNALSGVPDVRTLAEAIRRVAG